MQFSWQEHWSELSIPSSGDLPEPGIKPRNPTSQADSLPTVPHEKFFVYFNRKVIVLQYYGGFCHALTWISHGCTCVPHCEHPSHIPPHPISLGCRSALAFSAPFHSSNVDWSSLSHMVTYMFQCYSLKSSHLHLLPQSPKVCYLYTCLFCCPGYRVVVTIFLNSIKMH